MDREEVADPVTHTCPVCFQREATVAVELTGKITVYFCEVCWNIYHEVMAAIGDEDHA